jgi:hypothetical protein
MAGERQNGNPRDPQCGDFSGAQFYAACDRPKSILILATSHVMFDHDRKVDRRETRFFSEITQGQQKMTPAKRI